LKQLWNQRPELRKWARETLTSRAMVLEPFLVRSGNRFGKAGVRGEVGGGVSRTTYGQRNYAAYATSDYMVGLPRGPSRM
jgi:hypothetical protein